jgi:hypothetical protein
MKWYQLWYAATQQLKTERDPVIIKMVQHRIEMFKYLMGEAK